MEKIESVLDLEKWAEFGEEVRVGQHTFNSTRGADVEAEADFRYPGNQLLKQDSGYG